MSLAQIIPHAVIEEEGGEESELVNARKDKEELINELTAAHDGLMLKIYTAEIHNPYPMGVDLKTLKHWKEITEAIALGITAIVKNYFTDDLLHKGLLQLTPASNAILRVAAENLSHYNIGCWRPDFLLPSNDGKDIKICEINARFAFNGFYVSHAKNAAISSLSYLKDASVLPIQEQESVPDLLLSNFDLYKDVGLLKNTDDGKWGISLFQQQFNAAAAAAAAAAAQNCSDSSSGVSIAAAHARFVKPSSLYIDIFTGKVCDEHGPLQQFVFELSQASLNSMDQEILRKIIIECTCLNDIRTVLVAHDKRMLAVLSDYSIMQQYVPHTVAELLARHIVPTFLTQAQHYYCSPRHATAVLEAKRDRIKWMLKPNDGGKGEGIVFGRNCASDEEWCTLLDSAASQYFIIQPVVQQHLFSIRTARSLCAEKMLVVGLLPCFNKTFFGPGIFRASTADNPIVNVAGGKGVLLSPVLLSSKWPLKRKILSKQQNKQKKEREQRQKELRISSSFSSTAGANRGHLGAAERTNLLFDIPQECKFSMLWPPSYQSPVSASASSNSPAETTVIDENVKYITTPAELNAVAKDVFLSLEQHGIALVDTNWLDNNLGWAESINNLLMDVVSRIGIVNPHKGTKADVWDVRPGISENINNNINNNNCNYDSNIVTSSSCSNTSSLGNDSDAQPRLPPPSSLPPALAPVPAPPPRSHTADEFPMHTDCSFEDPPPRFIALFVMQHDEHDGGLSTFIDTDVLMKHLSQECVKTLYSTDFSIRVPVEFFKGRSVMQGRVIFAQGYWRYRADTIVRELCSATQLQALKELDAALSNPHLILTTQLAKGTLLFLDNYRFFHGRTTIYDANRWLKRIRFNPPPNGSQLPSAPRADLNEEGSASAQLCAVDES